MSKSLLNSFRVRLLLLLAALLVLTLAAQYYVNLRTARTNTRFMIEQREAILAGASLGVKALNSNKYLDQLQDEAKQPLLGAQSGRVKNVLIVDDNGNIEDSLDKNQIPQVNPDSTTRFVKVKDISLPPLNSAGGPLSEDVPLPEGMNVVPPNRIGSAGAFYFPVETDQGRHYVIVVLDSANTMAAVFQRQGRQ
ncbi:MAG TPA: hypothetical protein VE863_04120, partial [Pyrinomonadaceae bacterium]|nr:hypothetical protein [Pyrinomonadaceae bacterium]